MTGNLRIPDSLSSLHSTSFENTNFKVVDINGSNNNVNSNLKFKDSTIITYRFDNPITLKADDQGTSDNGLFKYKILDDLTSQITGLATLASNFDFNIPSTLSIKGNQVTVTSIGSNAFKGKSVIITNNLIIPDSITSIGADAFKKCSGITGELIIPTSVKTIGGGAFNDTKLTKISYNSNFTKPDEGILHERWYPDGCAIIDTANPSNIKKFYR